MEVDKIAEIRREIALRGDNFINQSNFNIAMKSASGVIIYGVPLSESEIDFLDGLLDQEFQTTHRDHLSPHAATLAAMLERRKK